MRRCQKNNRTRNESGPVAVFRRLWLELVCRADADDYGVLAPVVEHGLPFQAGRKVPVAGYLEVETSADVQACGPLADVIGRETHCRINAPAFAQVEDVLRVDDSFYIEITASFMILQKPKPAEMEFQSDVHPGHILRFL